MSWKIIWVEKLYDLKNYMSWKIVWVEKLYELKNYMSWKIIWVEKLYELKLYELKTSQTQKILSNKFKWSEVLLFFLRYVFRVKFYENSGPLFLLQYNT